ncbi:MAG: hypothetical protein AB8H86_22115 [Polyangiales bacterium]
MNLPLRALLPLVTLAALALGACGDDATGCLTNAQCASGEMCVNGECASRERPDGASEDAPGDDAGPGEDAGPETDGGTDAGPQMDAGPAVCDAACDTGNPCELGAFNCDTGEPVCEAVGPATEGTACREVEGECDVPETCDGVSMECPENARVEAGSACREASDVCDVTETCDGTSPACPIDAFAATGTTCPAGFCDGSGVCSDSCTPGAACDPGVLCRVGTVDCSGGAPSCELAGNDTNGSVCGTSENGSWSACSFGSTCAETGTQTRPVTSYACNSGTCGASIAMESRACTRSTDGAGCGSPSTGDWSACGGFDDACDLMGTRTRTVSTPSCSGGSCTVTMSTQSEACSRNTNGVVCGSVSNGAWGSCGYSNSCDESAAQTRTVTTPTCGSGTCNNVNTTQTGICNRDTDGVMCGTTTTGLYGSCRSTGGFCSTSGNRSRTVTERQCSSGACSDVTSTESVGCSINTNGNPCPGPECAANVCSGGVCNNTPSCPPGQTCCGDGFGCQNFCP